MRLTPVLSVALAALFVASIAFAAKPQSANAVISELGASGISGSADLRIDPQSGNVRVHESLSGLTPGAQYSSVIYLNSSTCGAGVNVVPVEVMTFTANPAGKATFNAIVPPAAVPLFDGGASISVQQSTTLLGCGTVIAQ